MSNGKQATRKAIPRTTRKEIPRTAQPPEQTFNITFGTLSFTIHHEDSYNQERYAFTPGMYRPQPQLSHSQLIDIPVRPTLQKFPGKDCAKEGKQTKFKDSNSDNKQKPAQRFVKIPPATTNWQRAVRGTRHTTGKIKKCFHCNKKGHVQKHCWKRLKCFTCREMGHKSATCPFKSTKNFPNTLSKEQSQILTAPNHSTKTQPMEPIHGRPLTGDIFYPPTQELSEENDYLRKVGLIILIRGYPSTNLPRLVASKMSEVHGGRPSDYMVSQASISPYIITCRSMQSRDAIVQGGLYTVAQGQIQFTVHEWRPRFGMGHDPPTHQVWVRIVGLPLQAWTITAISEVIQRFGQPIEILPFGQAAGHYRDITALVATRHPARIPLAYAYREGDYSTTVEISILTSRRWDLTHFPPPPDVPPPPPRDGHTPASQTGGQWMDSAYHSSSGSSNTAPSEPTIDLSAWSPRSHRPMSFQTKQWKPKEQQPHDQPHTPIEHLSLRLFTRTLLSDHVSPPLKSSYTNSHTSATKNPTPTFQIGQLLSLLHASFWSVPNPIIIKTLPFLQTASFRSLTLRTAQKKLSLDFIGCDFSALSPRNLRLIGKKEILTLIKRKCGQGIFPQDSKAYPSSNMGPIQANKNSSLTSWAHSGPRLTHMEAHNSQMETLDAQAHNSQMDFVISDVPHEQNLSDSLGPQDTISGPTLHQKDSQLEKILSYPQSSDKTVSPMTLPNTPTLTHPLPQTSQHTENKRKGKMLPTRRSQRIKEKQRPARNIFKPLTKAKSQIAGLPFDLDSRETPLDATATLLILQATGLQVNEEIQKMIHEASNENNPEDTPQLSTPSTPLHDSAPPLLMPGEDLVL